MKNNIHFYVKNRYTLDNICILEYIFMLKQAYVRKYMQIIDYYYYYYIQI